MQWRNNASSILKIALASAIVVGLTPVWGQLPTQKSTNETLWPGKTWTVASSPEAAGWSSEKLRTARTYGDSIHSSAVMIVRGGEVVYQLVGESSVANRK